VLGVEWSEEYETTEGGRDRERDRERDTEITREKIARDSQT
jgi:hypothetical protein